MFNDYQHVLEVVQTGFGERRVLVVGDLMLDRYLWGRVGRISPEAPVPVVRLERRSEVAGGAANVAVNLARLGLRVTVTGIVGMDAARESLLAILSSQEIDTQGIIALPDGPTITKTRIIGGHQQMIRIDEEEVREVDAQLEGRVLEHVLPALAEVDAVVLSDYAKGLLSPAVCQRIIREARHAGIPVVVDPKGEDYQKYAGAAVVTPNLQELALATGQSPRHIDKLLAAADLMRESLDLQRWIVTRGEQGISLIDADGIRHFPATAREVYDVSGAGDTVVATVTAGMVAGLDWDEALRLANVAAGVVVGKVGTAPVNQGELARALQSRRDSEQANKLFALEGLKAQVAEWRARGEHIVFTNGCFDILHVGHVTYLEQAAREGHRLIVGLNTDRSIGALKGPSRPIVSQADRARVLASLAAVDAVVLFDEDTPLQLIRALQPDVLVKGADYTEDQVVGAAEVKRAGGKVVLISTVEGQSTTRIVDRMKSMV